ncbi:MAG: DNA repair protein RadA [Acidimicrobiia bacterium]
MKMRTTYRCAECGAEAPRWLGRCPACESWGSLQEHAAPVRRIVADGRPRNGAPGSAGVPAPIVDVDAGSAGPVPTGVGELDRVLGGGLVPGSVTLLAGEPGMGKSTLLLQALGSLARHGTRCLLVTAEESCAQVRVRADRVGALVPELLVVAETSLPHVIAHVDAVEPAVLALDSIQTVVDADQPGAPGSVSQVRDGAHRLVQLAKERALPTVLVGHVTKDGTLAGPRLLEHVVDTVLTFDGDRGQSLRLLRALKHRFGSTHELGLFEMGEEGLADVPDASARFLVDRRAGAIGSAIAGVLEGTRPLLVEVQSLVVESTVPRRTVSGVDAGRLGMLLAVLDQHRGFDLAKHEVYASVAGGLRVAEPGIDLALLLAVASARLRRPMADGIVAVGEVGLGGEVRSVPQLERRLAEAARLGMVGALVPPGAPTISGLPTVEVGDVDAAITHGLVDVDDSAQRAAA